MASRIYKSIKNAKVNVIFYIISAVLAFFSRKIFLNNLGTEFLGLSSTLGDILNLMNITELGIGTAVGVTLYKPLFDNDHDKINDIISVYGYLYSNIGKLIGAISIALSFFFPLIFKNTTVPLLLVYFMFFSMVYGSLLGYFINYKQIILSASQNNYVIMYRYNTINIIKTILQMCTSFLPFCYIWWIFMELISSTTNSIILNISVKKHYPWLNTSIKIGKLKFKHYTDLWTKTKQVFTFKLSHLIFNGSINILISIFSSLSMAAIYGNYNMLMSKVTAFFDGLFINMGASIGNLISQGDKGKLLKVFFELLSLRYFIAGLCSITLYFAIPKLIIAWIGKEYILSQSILILMSVHIFILQARLTVTNFKDAYGLFQDTWAPIIEVFIGITLSLILGKLFGLAGILFAFTVADFLIKICWQPFYLFKKGFQTSVFKKYLPVFFKYIIILLVTTICILFIDRNIKNFFYSTSILSALAYSSIIGCIVLLFLIVLFTCFDKHFRGLISHLRDYKKNRRSIY